MSANVENSSVVTGLEKSVFIPIPKKVNAKECSNYCTIALISQASNVMLTRLCIKSFKLGFSSTSVKNFQIYKLGVEEKKEPEIKLQIFVRSWRK